MDWFGILCSKERMKLNIINHHSAYTHTDTETFWFYFIWFDLLIKAHYLQLYSQKWKSVLKNTYNHNTEGQE